MGYRETGIETYGSKCEICGYGIVEVHHIGYQEHQEYEDLIRYLHKNGQDYSNELEEARLLGFLEYNTKTRQLAKDDRSTNLSCLCGNCHGLIHKLDAGMKLLKVLPKRK